MRMKKTKNGSTVFKNEVTGGRMMSGRVLVIHWVWKLCNVAFECRRTRGLVVCCFNFIKVKGRRLNARIIKVCFLNVVGKSKENGA